MKTITLEFDFEQLQLIKDSLDLHFNIIKALYDEKNFESNYKLHESTVVTVFNGLCNLVGGFYENKNNKLKE